ncbi:hypothetical protein HDU97_004515 [Phlyctochytrium planicorne]|nr:hypothetical protein HDU97_004515 [Phlyctochytrium planicorne]
MTSMGLVEHASLAVELATLLDDTIFSTSHLSTPKGALIITDQNNLNIIKTSLSPSNLNQVLNLDIDNAATLQHCPQIINTATSSNHASPSISATATPIMKDSPNAKPKLPQSPSAHYRLVLIAREDLSNPPSPPPPPAPVISKATEQDLFESIVRRVAYAICQVLLIESDNERNDREICIYLDADLAEPISRSVLCLIDGMGMKFSSTIFDMAKGDLNLNDSFSLRKVSVKLLSAADIASDMATIQLENSCDIGLQRQEMRHDQQMDRTTAADAAELTGSGAARGYTRGSVEQQSDRSQNESGRETYRAIFESIMLSRSNIFLYQPLPPSSPIKRALIVEDNKINQRILERTLKLMGIHSVIVENGLDCLCVLFGDRVVASTFPDIALPGANSPHGPDTRFDIIFMDIVLPILDGIATAHAIRGLEDRLIHDQGQPSASSSNTTSNRCHIVAISSLCNADMIARCFHAGMDGFILKPWKKSDIERACGYNIQPSSPTSSPLMTGRTNVHVG